MEGAVGMVRRRVDGVEAKRLGGRRVDHIVLRPGRDDHGRPVSERVPLSVEDGLSLTGLDADELVDVVVALLADFLADLKRHDDELAVRRGEEYLPEIAVLHGPGLDVDAVAGHRVPSSSAILHRQSERNQGGYVRSDERTQAHQRSGAPPPFLSKMEASSPAPTAASSDQDVGNRWVYADIHSWQRDYQSA